jgi:hypothetical protein
MSRVLGGQAIFIPQNLLNAVSYIAFIVGNSDPIDDHKSNPQFRKACRLSYTALACTKDRDPFPGPLRDVPATRGTTSQNGCCPP